MLFNSIRFLIFFPIVITVNYLLPFRYRKYFMLAASCYFYMSFIPKYMLILLFTTCVDFFGARIIDIGKHRKSAFITALILNIGLLVFFKYLGMLGDTINFFGASLNLQTVVIPEIILPIGISFHTFQSMGYLIDVYSGKQPSEKNFIDFSLFLMFFPQLVAGPIERSGNLMSQLKTEHHLTYDNISFGGRHMLWGMFKKVVAADNLALFADAVFGNIPNTAGIGLIIGIICFTVQIYCDFSGYSDIAIGCAKILGIDLMTNFDAPYFSASTGEFWRRWHISLSTWFRDYIYIPLGGNRVSFPRWCLNQIVTFTVSGIWHGASFTFAAWGMLNGIYVILGRALKPCRESFKRLTGLDKRSKLNHIISVALTFSLISMTWVFFRSDSFNDAFYVFGHLFKPSAMDFSAIPELRIYAAVIAVIILWTGELLMKNVKIAEFFVKAPAFLRIISYAFIVSIIIIFGAYDNKAFIYFQF